MDVLGHAEASYQNQYQKRHELLKREPLLLILICALLYGGFHLIRPALDVASFSNISLSQLPSSWLGPLLGPMLGLFMGLFQRSFPSLLLGAAMVASIVMIARISFRTAQLRFLWLTVAVSLAAVWFEIIIPYGVPSSVGSVSDGIAMLLGAWLSLGVLSRCKSCQSSGPRRMGTKQDEKSSFRGQEVGSLTPN